MNNELQHYGVPGMKWGVRRSSSTIKADRLNQQIEKTTAYGTIARNTSNALNSASNITNNISRNSRPSKKVKQELSRMSDQELRTKINRINMEREYSSLNPGLLARGASTASNVLSTIGNLAAIGGSIAGIAVALHVMKKG